MDNLDCAGCFHQSKLVNENNEILKKELREFEKKKYNSKEAFIHLKSSYATNSLVFRNNPFCLPEWFLQAPNDWALEILISQYGFLGYIDKNMSSYRLHESGVWSKMSRELQHFEEMYRLKFWFGSQDFPFDLKEVANKKFSECIDNHPAKNDIYELNKRLKYSLLEIKLIKNSISWKITKPLRIIDNLLKKIQGKPHFNE
jgi:hypothetical protein